MNQPQRRAVQLADGSISYLEWNVAPNAPILVFAHANGFNARTYSSLLGSLSEKFHIFALDMRGHGCTTLPTDPALVKGWRVYSDDLLRFVERLGVPVKLLAGHSLGGTACLMAAAAEPGVARALVLIEPVLPTDRIAATAAFAHLFGLDDRLLLLAAGAKRRRSKFASREAAIAGFKGRGAFKSWPENLIADYVQGGVVEDGEGGYRLACSPQWEAVNFAEFPFGLAFLGRKVKVPLTVLHGTERSTAPEPQLRRLVKGHSDVRVVRVEGASHFLPMERPEIVREEILAAAKRVLGE